MVYFVYAADEDDAASAANEIIRERNRNSGNPDAHDALVQRHDAGEVTPVEVERGLVALEWY
jgi:hypothetical protein